MDPSATTTADAEWVERYKPLAERTFDLWVVAGEWPPADQLQRDLDRAGLDIDVIAAAEQIPRRIGEQRAVTPSAINLPLRLLVHLPQAETLVATCMAIVRRTIALYMSDSEQLLVTSTDLELAASPDVSRDLLGRAAALISAEYPNPYGGSSASEGSWNLNINVSQARKFRGVLTLPDYLERQAQVLADMHPRQAGGQPPELPSSVFVIMPFGTEWSAGVYDLIKRAAESLRPELDVLVYRADEISRPGKITDQIVHAIRESNAIIADITGDNPNVMWELGYAQALDKAAVILNQSVHEAPFDLRDWRQLVYGRTPTDTDARKLAEHLREALVGS